MSYTRIFRVPDYYTSFTCKCGDCKHTCCHGWAITVSMAEYFRLQGLDCSRELRRSLDCAFVPVDNPTSERYASFNYDWRGDCRLHRESDGLCAIQHECGEEPLPAICRMYPRAVHTRLADECCCSAGCEAVADRIIARTDRLTFTELELTVPLEPEQPERTGLIAEYYRPVRDKCLAILQTSALPLHQRLDALTVIAAELDKAIHNSDRHALDRALIDDYTGSSDSADVKFDLRAAKLLANYYGRHSRSLAPYSEAAAEYYGTGTEVSASLPDLDFTLERYGEAQAQRAPFELAAENLLANELFISGFPFNTASPCDAADALRALYLLLRYITGAADDSAYAVFRVADNTDFAAVAPRLLRGAR